LCMQCICEGGGAVGALLLRSRPVEQVGLGAIGKLEELVVGVHV